MENRFSRAQKMVLAGMVLAYISAYLCRLNLSAALGSIAAALQLTDARAGMLQTCFAVVYAAGQLLNGAMVDRVSPVRHMMLGMAGFACVNLLMSTATGFGMLMVLCMVNGVFQSMLWTPIVRLLALYFEGRRARSKANVFISLTLVTGHFAAWAISGFMAGIASWRLSFSVPAVLAGCMIFVVRYLFKDVRVGTVTRKNQDPQTHEKRARVLPLFAKTGFLLVLGACILYGFTRDGIVTWSPKMLSAMSGGMDATVFTLIIPLINTLGILAGKWLNMRGVSSNRLCVALMLSMSAVFCAPLFLTHRLVLTAMLMGFACAGLYGLNPFLTALVPLEYDKAGRVGMAAGLVDSFIYLGSALAGVLGGSISQHFGNNGLYVSWLAAAVLAAGLCFLAGSKKPMQALEKYSAEAK